VVFLSVAMDGQGWKVARSYVEKAGLTFPAVVDRDGIFLERLDFEVVPLQILFDEQGREILRSQGGPDEALLARLDRALAADPAPQTDPDPGNTRVGDAGLKRAAVSRLFAEGVDALERGDTAEAAGLWRRALGEDPGNWLIRKQIWALENPDRFYDGRVDYAWQREQMAREKTSP
jgi:hypothetical protein